MTTYKIHPLAEIFPPFTDSEFKILLDDIRQNGQREPITLFEGKILDGVHRYKACQKLSLEARVRNYNGKDPLGFAVSENFARRHWNESQRILIGAKIANLKQGRPLSNSKETASLNKPANLPIYSEAKPTQEAAAKMMNVSPRSIRTGRQILQEAPKKEIKAIERGEKTVGAVAREIKEGKHESNDEPLTDKLGRVIPKEMVTEWQRAEQTGKKLQSLAREIKSIVSEGFAGPKQDKLKDVIYAEVGNSIIGDANALAYTLSTIIPYALCPTCQGFNRNNCILCRKRGWISRFLWNSPVVSEATRKLIQKA